MPYTMTHAIAIAEIARRKDNKGLPKGEKQAAAYPELLKLTGADLEDAATSMAPKAKRTRKAQAQAPAPTPAPSAGTTPERTEYQRLHTELRAQAWKFRAAEFKAGRKITVAEANALFGTAPASVTNA